MFTFLFLSSCSLPAIECSLSLFRNVRTYISSSPGRSLPVPSDCLVPGVVPGSPSPFSWGVPLVSTVSCSLLCLTSHVSLLVESVLQQLPKLAEEALLRCRRLSILIYPHFLELGQVSILDWRSFTSEFRRHCLFPFTSLVTAENSDAVTIPGFSLLEVFRIFFLVSNVVHVPDEVSRCRMGVFLSLVLGSFHRNYLTFPPLCVLCMFASPISFASSLRVSLFFFPLYFCFCFLVRGFSRVLVTLDDCCIQNWETYSRLEAEHEWNWSPVSCTGSFYDCLLELLGFPREEFPNLLNGGENPPVKCFAAK